MLREHASKLMVAICMRHIYSSWIVIQYEQNTRVYNIIIHPINDNIVHCMIIKYLVIQGHSLILQMHICQGFGEFGAP